MSNKLFLDNSIRTILATLLFPLTISQSLLSRHQLIKNKPTGQIVRVDERNVHVIVSGNTKDGKPTVILESGMGGCALGWSLVQPELSKHTAVLSYDRAGFGWSTSTNKKPTIQYYVDELQSLLKALNLKPPYILVGHSYGGMIMRLFASQYPNEVEALILVDSTHETRFLETSMSEQRSKGRKKNLNLNRIGYILSPIGILRILKKHIGANRLPSHIQKTVTALGSTNRVFKAAYMEVLCTEESAIQLRNASPLRHDLPVYVLSAGKQTLDWIDGQKELLNLSNQTKQIIVQDSWHAIQIYKPDIVIETILNVINKQSRV